jgi:peroxiredoxin
LVQIRGMRWLAMIVVVASATAGAAPASNPAFAGVGLQDMPPMGCLVGNLINGAPAKDAGVHLNDLILAVDGVPLVGATQTPPCSVFQSLVTSHSPGDTIRLDVRRGMDSMAIKVTLSTRAEVLHRRYSGKPLASTSVPDADDPRRTYDFGELSGHVTLIGFFHADACTGCAALFDHVRDELRERLHDDAPEMLAVTMPTRAQQLQQPQPQTSPRKLFASSVALAVAPADGALDVELLEADRVVFMIVDARGIVRFVSPLAPGADDSDAALDEVLAAAEQLARPLRR